MFTPPPSPFPSQPRASSVDTPTSDVIQIGCRPIENTLTSLSKYTLYRSLRWTVVVVPLALVSLAACTRFGVHPAVFDLFSSDSDHSSIWTKMVDWSLHEPHTVSSNRFITPNRLIARDTTTPTPTVPANPVLPTPFPQPFDTTLAANFSTTSCYDFFLNMTQGDAFRTCRPFSLLLTTSHEFEMAQNNLDSMNTDIWGTCNTETPAAQCDANMSWFASNLQSSCSTDLGDQVMTAMDTLSALGAYDLMRTAACQVDQATNSYCFVEAVASSDPSSFWFYRLFLGDELPTVTSSACNTCTSGLMALYASALSSNNGAGLEALGKTYNTAATTLNKMCGSTYAKMVQLSSSTSSAWLNASTPGAGWMALLVLFAWMLCGS